MGRRELLLVVGLGRAEVGAVARFADRVFGAEEAGAGPAVGLEAGRQPAARAAPKGVHLK
jgi:hypothetical protein